MKIRIAHLFLVLALTGVAMVLSGCNTPESDNASVRPWNSPQGWEGNALGGMDQQHR
ncbi:MAG TPA: hypothetical protein VF607_08770 [Verrucomicrobiae bacterium]